MATESPEKPLFAAPNLPPWHSSPKKSSSSDFTSKWNLSPMNSTDRSVNLSCSHCKTLDLRSSAKMKPIRVNQSFPRMNSPRKKSAENCDLRLFLTRCDWPDFRDELDHSSGWPGLRRPFELDRSVQQSELENISTIRVTNPNKAVAVVDSESRILITNKRLGTLLGYQAKDMVDKKIGEIVKCFREAGSMSELVFDDIQHLSRGGTLVSGNVVQLVLSNGKEITASLKAKELEGTDRRVLLVIEPVKKTVGKLRISSDGMVLEMDEGAKGIFNKLCLNSPTITELIPDFDTKLLATINAKEELKLELSAKNSLGTSFPVAMKIGHNTTCNADGAKSCYDATVWVFFNQSGLITLSPCGQIQSYHPGFILALFGYAGDELVGKFLIRQLCIDTT